ncbi:tRNA pseudouridine synthase A [Thalassocella blandensis]|nr:tRNA pseudouridine synthase A [Thalassocella blandensis]
MYKRNCEIKPGIEFPEGMQRIMAGVEYNGAAFNGFQKQASTANTVQAKLEKALSKVANETVSCVCAGRTDAGVHAGEQIIHFDTLAQRPDKAWVFGANTQLPDDIRVLWATRVTDRFHARFSAEARTYRYVIYSADIKPACMSQFVTWTTYTLDISAMQQAGNYLLGEHDFSSFRSSQCQAHSPVRTIEKLQFSQQGRFIVMEIKANAFLHHMVRNIAGSLIEVGRGAKPREWLLEILEGKDRTKAAATAYPWGLYFVRAHYPVEFDLPHAPAGPVFLG